MDFTTAVSFPVGGGSKLGGWFIAPLNGKPVVYREFARNTNFSEIETYPLPDYKELYKRVTTTLDDFLQHYTDASLHYKGVNLSAVARRALHIFLTEYYNKLHQLRTFSIEHADVTFKADKLVANLLSEHGIPCRTHKGLTYLYQGVDTLRKIKNRFVQKPAKNRLNQDLYIRENPGKPRVLSIGLSVDRNKTFVHLTNYLRDQFECLYMHQESNEDPAFENNVIRTRLHISTDEHQRICQKVLESLKKVSIPQNSLYQELHPHLIQSLADLLPSTLFLIDVLETLHQERKLDLIIMGMTFYWIYNIAVQWAKANQVVSIFLQDVFLPEDVYHFIDSDKTVTGSHIFQEHLIHMGYPEKNLYFTSQVNQLLTHSPLALKEWDIEHARHYLRRELGKRGVSIESQKIILVATDPGNYSNTRAQKYYSERLLLEEAGKMDGFYVILKLHPGDDGYISRKALHDAKNSRAIVLKDIDFYQCLAACDVFVSKYSTSVLEAIMMSKFVLLMNHEGGDFYQQAVQYGLAHYLEKTGDLQCLYQQRDRLMADMDSKRHQYLEAVYYKEQPSDPSVSEILNHILEEQPE